MSRLRYDNSVGTLGASLTDSGTTITFASAPAFDTLTGSDYIALVLEPTSTSTPAANYEVVWLTAYTAAATTGTIERGQEGTSGVAHSSGVAWMCGPTSEDLNLAATLAYTDAAVGVETTRAEAAEAALLPLAGGTMSGAIAMGSNKVTGLTNGSAASDAAAFGQVLALVATTPAAGFALQNSTPTILQWTAPNDGALHNVLINAILVVSATESGGELQWSYTLGGAGKLLYFAGGRAVGNWSIGGSSESQMSAVALLIDPGSTVSLNQFQALSAGAATIYATILGL